MEDKTKTMENIDVKVIFNIETILRYLKDKGWLISNINLIDKTIECSKQMDTLDKTSGMVLNLNYNDNDKGNLTINQCSDGVSLITLENEDLMVFSILKSMSFEDVAMLFFRR